MAILSLRHLTVRYNGEPVVQDLSLEVAGGETVILIGPSGCGKSSILRSIMGLVVPAAGTLVLRDQPVDPRHASAYVSSIGYVIQEGGLFPHLTIQENLTLAARYHGWDPTRRQNRLQEVIDQVHLSRKWLERYPTQLSGGQRQRVSLGRALFLNPDLLLLDEPLGALDPLIRAKLQDELKTLFQELGKGVLMVTHDLHEGVYLGTRIALMRQGKLVQVGSPDQLLHHPADPFVAEFIQSQQGRF